MPLALTGGADFIWASRECSREGMASGVHRKNERSGKRKHLFLAIDGVGAVQGNTTQCGGEGRRLRKREGG